VKPYAWAVSGQETLFYEEQDARQAGEVIALYRGDERLSAAIYLLEALSAHALAPVALPEREALPEFDSINDETIDAACVAGGFYRVDFMHAYNMLRAHLKGGAL